MKIDILGTEYQVRFETDEENRKLGENCNGLAELYSKELIIRTGYEKHPDSYNNILAFREKVVRHEVIHAFFHECGLDNYTEDETLVNCLAVQFPKLIDIMQRAKEIHEQYGNN